VVVLPPEVQWALLRLGVLRGRADDFFERAMKALEPPILLRLAGLDSLQPQTEFEPPRRQLREPPGAGRGERRPVVGADRIGKSEFLKRAVEHTLDVLAGRFQERFGAQQEARVRILQ